MLLLITVMCVITEKKKKMQLNIPSQQVLVGPSWASYGHLSGPQEWLPMWDPQKYDRGISMGPMCGSPSTIWAAHVGPTNI